MIRRSDPDPPWRPLQFSLVLFQLDSIYECNHIFFASKDLLRKQIFCKSSILQKNCTQRWNILKLNLGINSQQSKPSNKSTTKFLQFLFCVFALFIPKPDKLYRFNDLENKHICDFTVLFGKEWQKRKLPNALVKNEDFLLILLSF